MSAAFVASPASSEGLHDGFQHRMRLDTQAQRQQQQQQQQDAQSFLSAESPFEEIGLSTPNSYVLVSPEESTHAHNSDIGAEDWQLMPSPQNQYGVPHTSGGETRHAQQQYPGAAQYIPRNLSVTSSMSSIAANTGHYHSPMSSSPVQPFRRHSPYFPAAQGQPQSFAESFNRWSSAAPMQNITASTTNTVYFPNMNADVPILPSNYTLASDVTPTPAQEPWSAFSRHTNAPMAFNPDFHNPHLDLSFSSATESTIQPPTHEDPHFPVAWPLSSTDTSWLPFDAIGRATSIDLGSPGSSDLTDARSKLHRHDDTDTSSRRFSHQPSPMPNVKMEKHTPPLHDDSVHTRQFEFVSEPRHQPRTIASGSTRPSKRVGGRQIGSKFERDKAERIKQRREDGACWTCSLQRDEVCSFSSYFPPNLVLVSC